MSPTELETLSRAHGLFTGGGPKPEAEAGLDAGAAPYRESPNPVAAPHHYRQRATRAHAALGAATHTDSALGAIVAGAHRDRATARQLTGDVLDRARADAAASGLSPLAQREALRRRVARLRAQREHVASARGRSRRHAAALRALRYRAAHHRGGRRLPMPSGRAGLAVRAALSRLGRPYVWGATGPDRFDCSGLVQWAYAQAGVHLDRTTYQQINEGVPVPRSQVRPGDLVFPHTGHVQLAIGNNLVVEAPYPGASVRISPLGGSVAIRRPL